MDFNPDRHPYRLFHFSLILIALVLRVLIFPHPDEMRNVDENCYLEGSLAILEGESAGYKAAPAGPNFWVGWVYAASLSAWNFVHPGPEERAVPITVRPFIAVNHALFDLYRDMNPLHELWIGTQLLLTVWATSAAFRLGAARGGLAGGLFVGGFMAAMPLYVEFTDMSRPYMTAWAFAVLALHAAVCGKPGRRVVPSSIFLGLAIASRVEMLLFAPMVLWEFWFRCEPGRLMSVLGKTSGVTLMTALLAAPWLLTHLIGNLRTIATVRLGPNPTGPTTFAGVLLELAWHQGLAGAMLAFVGLTVALVLPRIRFTPTDEKPPSTRIKIAVLCIYVAMLLESLAHGTVFLHQQGPVLLALVTSGAFACGVLSDRLPTIAPWIVTSLLLIPLGQTLARINLYKQNYAPDPSVAWVEAHVPAGTRVYLQTSLRNPLPTSASSAALWDEVTDDAAWRRKFSSGLERFGVSADQIPRALSDENLVQERGKRRCMFILGGRPGVNAPRYDLQLFDSSPVFGVQNIVSAFAASGGVVIVRGQLYPALGIPVAQWMSPAGTGNFIYWSPQKQRR